MTREGFAGVVDRVEDGPFPGNESYIVTLEANMGGGEYSSSELTEINNPFPHTAAEYLDIGDRVKTPEGEGVVTEAVADCDERFPALSTASTV